MARAMNCSIFVKNGPSFAGVGYGESDIGGLSEGAILQQRLLKNAPCEVALEDLRGLYRSGMHYW